MRNRLVLLALLLGILALAYFSGFYQYLAPDRLRALIHDAGPWGPIMLVLLFSILEPFGTPGILFLFASATLWTFWPAFLVNCLGATGAGMVGFAFARYIGRDWVEGKMPKRLREWDDRLTQKGLSAVILFRLFFFLNPASHWALGLSRVPVTTALLGTFIGFVPGVAVLTYFGAEILTWFEAQSIGTWAATVAAIATFFAVRHFRNRRQESCQPASEAETRVTPAT